MNFSERLKLLRNQNNTLQTELAEAIGISDRMIQMYEAGSKFPVLPKAIAIAEYFNVSIDYLVGRTDNPEVNR